MLISCIQIYSKTTIFCNYNIWCETRNHARALCVLCGMLWNITLHVLNFLVQIILLCTGWHTTKHVFGYKYAYKHIHIATEFWHLLDLRPWVHSMIAVTLTYHIRDYRIQFKCLCLHKPFCCRCWYSKDLNYHVLSWLKKQWYQTYTTQNEV